MSAHLPIAEATAAVIDNARSRWLQAGLPLAIGLTVLAVTYAPEISAAVRVWIESTAYGHCFLVLPVTGYLLYQRWDAVAASAPQPAPLVALAAVPVVLGWFVAERIGIMEARQLLAMVLVQILVVATVGPRTWWVMAAPLLYLFFLVPVGEFTTPWLQAFTTRFIAVGLDLLRIPHFVDGIDIEIPEGRFLVAEACAGLRFVIASVAFGAFYACLVYTSPMRRLVFIGLSLAVPVMANGFRALGIVLLGHVLGGAEAAAADHVLYGWVFFAIVTVLLILVGLPFRQSPQHVAPAGRTARATRAGSAAVAVLAIAISAVAPRVLADSIDGANAPGATQAQIELPLTPPARCSLRGRAPASLPRALPNSPAPALIRSYDCANGTVVLHLMVFPANVGADPVFAALRGSSILPGWDEVAANALTFGELATTQTWRITDLERQGRFTSVAAALWIDGHPSSGGILSRFRRASAALRRDPVAPVVAVLTSEAGSERERGRAAIESFLREANGVSGLIDEPLAPGPAGVSRSR